MNEMKITKDGNVKIKLTPQEARIVHGLLSATVGRAGYDLYASLDKACDEGVFKAWIIPTLTVDTDDSL